MSIYLWLIKRVQAWADDVSKSVSEENISFVNWYQRVVLDLKEFYIEEWKAKNPKLMKMYMETSPDNDLWFDSFCFSEFEKAINLREDSLK